MSCIIVTGANGFVGNNLIPYLLKEGKEVISVTRRASDGQPNHWIGYEKLTTEFVSNTGASAFVHLAGKAHDLKNSSSSKAYFDANTELTKKLYDLFLASTASVFIYISSVKAVADHLDEPLTENHFPEPSTHYGKSKLMAEKYIQEQPLPGRKSYYILRPCMIHGPGNRGNLNLLYKIASMGIPYPLTAFVNERSFLTVENLCFVIRELLEKTGIPFGIYNVSDDMPLSTNRVMEIISEEMSKKIRFLRVNKNIIKSIARAGDLFPFPLNSERLNKLTGNYVVSNRKLAAALNKPLPLDVETGLRRTIQSFIPAR